MHLTLGTECCEKYILPEYYCAYSRLRLFLIALALIPSRNIENQDGLFVLNNRSPCEVEHQFLEAPGQELGVSLLGRPGAFEHLPHGPGVHRRVDVVKRELVRWNGTVPTVRGTGRVSWRRAVLSLMSRV